MSAVSDTITGLANEFRHLSELAITRICRDVWPSLQRCEVVSILEKHNIDRPATNASDEYTRTNIQADAAEGMSHDMIAAKYGKTVGDVRYDGGLPSTTPAPEEGEDMEPAIGEISKTIRKDNVANRVSAKEIAQLRAQGKKWDEVAEFLEVGYSTLLRLVKDYNLPRKPEECRAWLDGKLMPAAAGARRITDTEPQSGAEKAAAQSNSDEPASGTLPVDSTTAAVDSMTAAPNNETSPPRQAGWMLQVSIANPVSPPLLTVSKRNWSGETARRRLQTLVAALDDAEIYDVELCIREVQA